MSPVDTILGLTGLVVQRVEPKRDIHVWARPAKRPSCVHCTQLGTRQGHAPTHAETHPPGQPTDGAAPERAQVPLHAL